jgi:predicted cobalt transporter CbtA
MLHFWQYRALALGLAFLYEKMGTLNTKKAIIPTAYAAIITAAYLAMPANPDPINAPMDLVIGFRITSAITISMFWGVLGVIFGTLWNKLNPDETARISVR